MPYYQVNHIKIYNKDCRDMSELADKASSLVLDPFAGSGTVAWVAKKLGRQAVGYELSEEYCGLALERNRQSVMEVKV